MTGAGRWPEIGRRLAPFYGSAGSAALRVISIACSLASITLAVKLLGPDRYGQYVLISAIAAWLPIAALGTPERVTQGLVKARQMEELHTADLLLKTGLVLSGLGGLAAAIGALGALACAQPGMAGDRHSFAAGAILLVGSALLTPTLLTSSVFIANGRIARDAGFKVAQPVLFLLLLVLLLLVDQPGGARLVAVCAAFVGALAASRLWAFARSIPLPVLRHRFSRAILRDMLATSAPFLIVQIAALLAFQTDRFIVNAFSSTAQLGSYDLVVRIYTAFYTLYSIPLQYIWSGAGPLWARGDGVSLRRYVRRFLLGSMGFWVASSLVVTLAAPLLITLVSGRELPSPGLLVGALVGGFFLVRGTTDVLTLTLYATERQGRTLVWVIAHGLSNVAFAWIGGHYAGIAGVVAGQILSFVISTLVPFYVLVFHSRQPGATA
jgi:O-antigen/teichoic acid export membrane protein